MRGQSACGLGDRCVVVRRTDAAVWVRMTPMVGHPLADAVLKPWGGAGHRLRRATSPILCELTRRGRTSKKEPCDRTAAHLTWTEGGEESRDALEKSVMRPKGGSTTRHKHHNEWFVGRVAHIYERRKQCQLVTR